jgi:phosphoesterase RecJ-like protein
MIENLKAFIERNDFFILTTHDPADADGLGAQMVFSRILQGLDKQYKIINASPVPEQFRFIDGQEIIEHWDVEKHDKLPEKAAVFMLDTGDLHNIGKMRDPVSRSKEVFIVDHHEILSDSYFPGICDSKAASTCEFAVEIAEFLDIKLDIHAAFAAYSGIVYDTGFFAYQKTGTRTFRTALLLIELGVNPNEAYQKLCENASTAALFLQQKALSSLTLHCNGQVAAQMLRYEDFTETGAMPDDTDGIVSIPLKSKEIVVSVLVKESQFKKIRCSLRSKGKVDVFKIAHALGGGGHFNAAGFKSDLSIEQTLSIALAKITKQLEAQ